MPLTRPYAEMVRDRVRRDPEFALALLEERKAEIAELRAARTWQPMETAPRSQRVLVRYACGTVEIARQRNTPHGWEWVGDDGETDEANPDAVRAGWQHLPAADEHGTAYEGEIARLRREVSEALSLLRSGYPALAEQQLESLLT